jgi:hypothetical protein
MIRVKKLKTIQAAKQHYARQQKEDGSGQGEAQAR